MTDSRNPRGARVHLTAFGAAITLKVGGNGHEELESKILRAWDRCLVEGHDREPDALIEVVLDDRPMEALAAVDRGAVAATSERAVMHALSPRVTAAAITTLSTRHVLMHAGAVASESGATVALVGPSGAGKTTAVKTLGRHFGYVSDETTAVRGDDSVAAYPKPLSILTGRDELKDQRSPHELGLHDVPQDLHLAGILILARDSAHRGHPELERVPMLEALPTVTSQISNLAAHAKPLHRLADLLSLGGGPWRVRYREADDLVPIVAEVVGS